MTATNWDRLLHPNKNDTVVWSMKKGPLRTFHVGRCAKKLPGWTAQIGENIVKCHDIHCIAPDEWVAQQIAGDLQARYLAYLEKADLVRRELREWRRTEDLAIAAKYVDDGAKFRPALEDD